MKSLYTFLIGAALCLATCARAQTYDYVIHDVNIITPHSKTPLSLHKDVYLRGEKIALISRASRTPAKRATHTIDASGKYLMAGLTDMHVHLPTDHIEQFFALNIAAGVTTVRSMRGKMYHLDLRKKVLSGKLFGPDLILATPYFPNRNIKIGMLHDSIARFAKDGFDCVKVLAVPDSAYFEKLMQAAKSAHIPVVGHWPWQVPIERVIESGYDCIEHLQGEENLYMKDSNSVNHLASLLVKHHTWNCPSLDYYAIMWQQVPIDQLRKRPGLDLLDRNEVDEWDSIVRARTAHRYAGAGDSVLRKYAEDSNYIARRLALVKALCDRGAEFIVSGADARDPFGVPGFCVWEELKWLSRCGLNNQRILEMATYDAAKYMHETKQWGSVAAGQEANLVLLNKNPLESIGNVSDQAGTVLRGTFYATTELRTRARSLR